MPRRVRSPLDEDGAIQIPLWVFGLLAILLILIIITMRGCGVGSSIGLTNPGIRTLTITPPTTSIGPGATGTFTVTAALDGTTGTLGASYEVRIDEDDNWDDTLIKRVTLKAGPNSATATGTFTLQCGTAAPDLIGADDTSDGENPHQIHAELSLPLWKNPSGPNATVTCARE